ncbi:MAG TPA: hypothetical protein VKB19_15605 [Pedobacter sp.]|nr:hypothetical protein [Pedobacter sp.]
MSDSLTIEIFPKNADVARVVFKSSTKLLRENDVFNYNQLVLDLQNMCGKLRECEDFNECLQFCDKKNSCYLMDCAFVKNDASLTISNMMNCTKKQQGFDWKGSVNTFIGAVFNMLRNLSKRSI